jgi:hypothetical protein
VAEASERGAGEPAWSNGSGGRWRESQRRRRRLSARGRASLAAIGALSFCAGFAVVVLGTDPEEPLAPIALASVEAPTPAPQTPPRELLERLPVGPDEVLELTAVGALGQESGPAREPGVSGRLFEYVPWEGAGAAGPLRVEYTLDAELSREVFRVLRDGRVALGHAVVLDPRTGRLLAYASTAPEDFPPTRAYPAASLVKIVTAAAALDVKPEVDAIPCRFTGSPYRLTPARIDPPRQGNTASLRKALATSNNQCFAQLAVHAVGGQALVETIERFGWLASPAPAHAAGTAELGEDRYDLGRLGCGLAGSRITPLHAAQLGAVLAEGELVAPHWIERVLDAQGRQLELPPKPVPRRVISPELAAHLREMLVDTTTRGTARSAFRARGGRPLLGPVQVAGKTGSLSSRDPTGRYEWFVGLAPAEAPRISIAVLVVQGPLWWRNASQIGAEILRQAFCSQGRCEAQNAERWLRPSAAAPALLAETPQPGPG